MVSVMALGSSAAAAAAERETRQIANCLVALSAVAAAAPLPSAITGTEYVSNTSWGPSQCFHENMHGYVLCHELRCMSAKNAGTEEAECIGPFSHMFGSSA